jgi:hypothetical protein
LEGRSVAILDAPLKESFGKFLERRYESLEVAKFSG